MTSSRTRIEDFCRNFLAGCYAHMLPNDYREIDIKFTKENIEPALSQICRNVLHENVNVGRVIALLGFAEVLGRRYVWCSTDILVYILVDVLEEVQFCPDSLKTEYYISL